jgi:hypothetical protein
VVALATVALVVGCASGGPVRPETGPAAGPVTVEVSAEPSPGATIVLDLSAADDRAVGSACATIDRWDSGGWRSTWWWERRSSSAQAIARGDEVSCPAIGVPLPTRMTLQLPDDLDAGTWRVAYAAGDDLGAYIFEVA